MLWIKTVEFIFNRENGDKSSKERNSNFKSFDFEIHSLFSTSFGYMASNQSVRVYIVEFGDVTALQIQKNPLIQETRSVVTNSLVFCHSSKLCPNSGTQLEIGNLIRLMQHIYNKRMISESMRTVFLEASFKWHFSRYHMTNPGIPQYLVLV